jgi:hypothetical protein
VLAELGHHPPGQLGRAHRSHMQQAGLPLPCRRAGYTPRSASSRPDAIAPVNAWKSRSFWSA